MADSSIASSPLIAGRRDVKRLTTLTSRYWRHGRELKRAREGDRRRPRPEPAGEGSAKAAGPIGASITAPRAHGILLIIVRMPAFDLTQRCDVSFADGRVNENRPASLEGNAGRN